MRLIDELPLRSRASWMDDGDVMPGLGLRSCRESMRNNHMPSFVYSTIFIHSQNTIQLPKSQPNMASSLLSSHLDQISLCASSISDLPFSRPKQFTNALLTHHDITALIRDTEAHERALFSIAPPPVPSKSQIQQISSTFTTSASRSATAGTQTRPPRRHTAVAAVLGGDLYRKTRSGHSGKQAKGDIDVELLLRGAEKLCRV